jgi:hypothetical protein
VGFGDLGARGPQAVLDVRGDIALNDFQLRIRGGGDPNHFISYLGGSFDGPQIVGNTTLVLKTLSGGDFGGIFMRDGRVGIGTTNPTNGRLHVESFFDVNFTYAYLNGSGATGCCISGDSPISIWAQHRVAAEEFNAFSDARIKKVIGLSNAMEDLQTLMNIEITDYQYRDQIYKGEEQHKKVIAQQVELIYPEAVSKTKGVIPDIYTLAEMESGHIQLENDLRVGDRVKLILEEKVELYEVLDADPTGFRVNADPAYHGKVFVYGREVEDFRTVDYEAISMLNVSATQELYRLIQAQQKLIDALNTKTDDQARENSELKAQMELNRGQLELNNTLLQELKTILGITSIPSPGEEE